MIDGTVLIDGGISNPVPFDRFTRKADVVLAVDVVGGPAGEPGTMPSRTEVLFGASQLMMQTTTSMKMSIHKPDIMIRPNINQFRVLDFLKVEQILEASSATGDEVKRSIEAAFRQLEAA
jgi:NTE family protein